jgi:hypothetical protein
MARVDATAAKAAAATAAADLTTILQDDTLTELFNDYKQNHHPMRGLENLFLLDPATGVVTANDAYIDAAYAGDYPTSGIESGRQSQGAPTPLALVSATIEAAEPTDIVLTFSEKVFENPATAVSVGGAAGGLKSIVSITYAGTVVTITMDSAFIAADVATVTGRFFNYRKVALDLADEAVTNNIV